MKEGKTISQLAREIERQAETARDFVSPAGNIQMLETAEIAIGGDAFRGELTEDAHGQMADKLGIPRSYYNRMRASEPELLATNANRWLQAEPATKHMIRTLDGNARAVLSDRYHRLDNFQILQGALPAIYDLPVEIVSSEVTDRRLYVQARFPMVQGEVKRGDVVSAGFILSNSETGFGALDIRPLVYRLVCTNGMVASHDVADGRLRRTHVGKRVEALEDYSIYADDTRAADDKALMLKIRDALSRLSNPDLFLRLMDKMRAATEGEQIVRPVAAVEELGKAFPLSEGEREGVLTALIRDQDYSRWGMLNAVTNIANTTTSYDRAVELQTLGGKLLDLPAANWQRVALAA
jgi:hypothetical protein